jgi:hypothetical protein
MQVARHKCRQCFSEFNRFCFRFDEPVKPRTAQTWLGEDRLELIETKRGAFLRAVSGDVGSLSKTRTPSLGGDAAPLIGEKLSSLHRFANFFLSSLHSNADRTIASSH